MAEGKVDVSREQVVEFIDGAFKEIANLLGLILTTFHEHLDNIEDNKCYAAMIEKRTKIKKTKRYILTKLCYCLRLNNINLVQE